MHVDEIETGKTYTDGKGNCRIVVSPPSTFFAGKGKREPSKASIYYRGVIGGQGKVVRTSKKLFAQWARRAIDQAI